MGDTQPLALAGNPGQSSHWVEVYQGAEPFQYTIRVHISHNPKHWEGILPQNVDTDLAIKAGIKGIYKAFSNYRQSMSTRVESDIDILEFTRKRFHRNAQKMATEFWDRAHQYAQEQPIVSGAAVEPRYRMVAIDPETLDIKWPDPPQEIMGPDAEELTRLRQALKLAYVESHNAKVAYIEFGSKDDSTHLKDAERESIVAGKSLADFYIATDHVTGMRAFTEDWRVIENAIDHFRYKPFLEAIFCPGKSSRDKSR